MPKEIRINVRASEELKDRLKRVCELTGLPETTLVMACLEGALRYVEKHGEITLPLSVIPTSELKKQQGEDVPEILPASLPSSSTPQPAVSRRANRPATRETSVSAGKRNP